MCIILFWEVAAFTAGNLMIHTLVSDISEIQSKSDYFERPFPKSKNVLWFNHRSLLFQIQSLFYYFERPFANSQKMLPLSRQRSLILVKSNLYLIILENVPKKSEKLMTQRPVQILQNPVPVRSFKGTVSKQSEHFIFE